jgi:hypothetical protein
MKRAEIPPALRDDLLTYLFCTSPDRARIIAELLVRNPGMGDLLADLEADDELRARLEIELLDGAATRQGVLSGNQRSKLGGDSA